MSSTTAARLSDTEFDRMRRSDRDALVAAMASQIEIAVCQARPRRIDPEDAAQEAVVVLLTSAERYADLPADAWRATVHVAMVRRIQRADGAGYAWSRDQVGLPEQEQADPVDPFEAVENADALASIWRACDERQAALLRAWAGDDSCAPTNSELARQMGFGSREMARRRVAELFEHLRGAVAA